MKKIARGQVWDVDLDPTQGAEIQKIRPCVVISADHILECFPDSLWEFLPAS